MVTSTILGNPARGCGIGSPALEGFSGVVLVACPGDWVVVSVVGVRDVLPGGLGSSGSPWVLMMFLDRVAAMLLG